MSKALKINDFVLLVVLLAALIGVPASTLAAPGDILFADDFEDGTLALTRGPYQMISIDDEGNPVERWGTFNSIWRLHDDGQWRVVFDAGSPSGKAPTDEQRQILESTCDAVDEQ